MVTQYNHSSMNMALVGGLEPENLSVSAPLKANQNNPIQLLRMLATYAECVLVVSQRLTSSTNLAKTAGILGIQLHK